MDEQEERFLQGRFRYELSFKADNEIMKKFRTGLKEQGIAERQLFRESVAPESFPTFVFEAAGLLISALTLAYTIYKDRQKKGIDVRISFPDQKGGIITNMEELADLIETLKQIDPQKEEEERKKTIERFRKLYRETYGDKE